MNILGMTREELLKLTEIDRLLKPEEVVYIARTFGAFWKYDYVASEQGRVGLHAELKSGLHSDGFFVSRIMLAEVNIRRIIANQIVMRLEKPLREIGKPSYVAGVPDGATQLGKDIAEILGVKCAEMQKVEKRIVLVTELHPSESILLIEDFCTRGTGFTEAVETILQAQPAAFVLPLDPVIINRGGLNQIVVKGVGIFDILPVVELRVQDWEPSECLLCKRGSKPIKPKATDENWLAITTS